MPRLIQELIPPNDTNRWY